jgi:hypothetical protein
VVNATKFSDVLISSESNQESRFNEYPSQPLHFVDLADLDGDVNGVLVVFTQVLNGFIIGLKAPDDLDLFACLDQFVQTTEEFKDIF